MSIITFTAFAQRPVMRARRHRLLRRACAWLALCPALAFAADWTPGEVFRDCGGCPEMVVLPVGEFMMGSPEDEEGRDDDEGPRHRVAIGQAFALGRYEVTVGEFRRFVEATGYATLAELDGAVGCWTAEFETRDDWGWTAGRSWRSLEWEVAEDQPVVCVSQGDAKAYVAWLSKRTGAAYRLPSEAEWEYAARAGSGTRYHFGDDEADLCLYGNLADETEFPDGGGWANPAACSDGAVYPAEVGKYRRNALGLHDMHGNAREWVDDCWNDSYAGAPSDGGSWLSGNCSSRVVRGGSWGNDPRYLRSANRGRGATGARNHGIGFRVARTLNP